MRAHDLTLAVRNLIHRPLFAITAILLLALGAGANAAVFSVVRGILLKPLAYQHPEQLVALAPGSFVSNEDLGYWRERTHSFEQIAALSPGWLMALVADGYEPLKVTGGRVSDNFFETLGVSPQLGRVIRSGDGVPGAARVVVLSDAIFRSHFGGDAAVLGRMVQLDGAVHQIVGVMASGFEFLEPGTDVWAPLAFDPRASNHRATFSQAFARLRPGTSIDVASQDLQALVPAMRSALGKTGDWGQRFAAVSLQQTVTGELQPTLLVLLAAVGLILLLAAVNLGTLVLGRTIERARELAVRTALGASRARIIRQLATEQAVLALAGAGAGVLIAWLVLPFLISRIPPDMPRQGEITLDLTVLATVILASLAVSLLFVIVPIAIAARPELEPLLRQSRSTDTPARRRILGGLVAAQVALAIVLGIGAGLMLRSLWNLQHIDPGFDAERVLAFRLQTTSKYPSLDRGLPYYEQVVERLRGVPGITHVGSIQHLPMTGYNWTAEIFRADRPPQPGTTVPRTVWRFIGWDYFQAMGIPLRAGRLFGVHDTANDRPVAIVNEALARREFGDPAAALGQRLVSTSGRGKEEVEIIGVTRDIRFESLNKPADPEIYRPLAQTFMFPMGFVVRTDGNPAQLARTVREAAYAIDPTVPVAELQPFAAMISNTLARPRLIAFLLTIFASVGLTLTVVGVYGVVAYAVRQREREFGIRLALGAAPRAIARSVIRQGVAYALVGVAIGLPAAFALTRLMNTLVFGITVRDPLTFLALPALLTAVILAASYVPARRAASVEPVTAMRLD
jgi:putative ABC transport system permease protein